MGKLVASEFVTVDGVFEDPGGAEKSEHGGWAFKFSRGEAGDKFKLDELMAADAQLLGRVTYEGFAEAWPKMADAAPFGEKMNSMPKYVVSASLQTAEWQNSTIIRDNVAEQVSELKARHEGDILVAGSGALVRWLLDAQLLDELRLMVFPIVLGTGKRLLDGAQLASLQLVEMLQTGDCATLTFRPLR